MAASNSTRSSSSTSARTTARTRSGCRAATARRIRSAIRRHEVGGFRFGVAVNSAATASLWFGVVAFGIFHGLNPAMGWPLAVANGLGEKRDTAVFATWLPLGTGHLLAMALVLVPFAVLTWMLQWGQQIRLGAGLL